MSELLTYEQAVRLNNFVAQCAIEAITYETWSDEFRVSNLKERITKMTAKFSLNPYDFTKEQLITLGFCMWDDDLALVPLGLAPFLAKGMLLTGIDNNSVVVGIDEIDMDARGGCIAYGIAVKG